jgi:SNF2 family DNA or RNA helicase
MLNEKTAKGLIIAEGDMVVGYMVYNEDKNFISELHVNPMYDGIGIERELLSYRFNENTTVYVDKDSKFLKPLQESEFKILNEKDNGYFLIRHYLLSEDNNDPRVSNDLAKEKFNQVLKESNLGKEIMDGCKEIALSEAFLKKNVTTTDRDIYEITIGRFSGSVIIDYTNKEFIIKGINYMKFLKRVNEIYSARNIDTLFEKNYTKRSQKLWELEFTNDRKIANLRVPLFFALEVYKIFLDLSEYYKLPYYTNVANKIWNKTWISKFQDRQNVETDITPLNNLNFEAKDYQRKFIEEYESLKNIYELEGYILSFEQGLGKTFTAIGLSECLKYVEQVIIVCPNSLKENWAYEVRDYFKEFQMNEAVWKSKVYVHNNQKYQFTKDTRYVIVNQESIHKIYKLAKKKNVMIIVDESHNFRNIDSQRSQELLKLKEITNCKDNLLMSGTPLKASPDELIPALRMIDPYFTPKMAVIYRQAFKSNSYDIYRVVRERFDRSIYRKTKKEVLKLPDKIIDEIVYQIPNADNYLMNTLANQVSLRFEEIYEEKVKNLGPLRKEFRNLVMQFSSAPVAETKDYLDYIDCTISGKEFHYVFEHRQMIYDNFLKDFVYPNIPNKEEQERLKFLENKYIHVKQSAMGLALGEVLPIARANCYTDMFKYNIKDVIKRINNAEKKTVIFTQFLNVANYITDALNKNKVGALKIIGETKDRMDVINKFKCDERIEVLVATSQTLSTGVTLTEANQIIFFGTPYRDADFQQCCDRIHRIGQTHTAYIYKTILDTGDELNVTTRMNDILNWSGNMFTTLIDNPEDIEVMMNEDTLGEATVAGVAAPAAPPSQGPLLSSRYGGLDNEFEHQYQDYDEAYDSDGSILTETLETRLTNPTKGKYTTLYHASSHLLDKIVPTCVNAGTRLSKVRTSSYWFDNFHFACGYAAMEVFGENKILRPLIYEHCFLDSDFKLAINSKYKSELERQCITNNIQFYIYEVTVPTKIVGRGHHFNFPEYTLDVPVKPNKVHVLNYNKIKKFFKYVNDGVAEAEMKSVMERRKNPSKNPYYEGNYFNSPWYERLVYHTDLKTKKIRDEYKQYAKGETETLYEGAELAIPDESDEVTVFDNKFNPDIPEIQRNVSSQKSHILPSDYSSNAVNMDHLNEDPEMPCGIGGASITNDIPNNTVNPLEYSGDSTDDDNYVSYILESGLLDKM